MRVGGPSAATQVSTRSPKRSGVPANDKVLPVISNNGSTGTPELAVGRRAHATMASRTVIATFPGSTSHEGRERDDSVGILFVVCVHRTRLCQLSLALGVSLHQEVGLRCLEVQRLDDFRIAVGECLKAGEDLPW